MAIEINGRVIETDEEGFLLDPFVWDREVALQIAHSEQLEMTDDRWIVVQFVREHFDERGTVPEARNILKLLERTLGKDRATRRFLQSLFPYGYGQQACKIAGMRMPRKLMLDV